jgi:hypothetical protein
MDYIKLLREMCKWDGTFDEFLRTGEKDAYLEFRRANDNYFYFDFEGKSLGIELYFGATKAAIHVSDEPTIIKIGFSDYKVDHAEREANIYTEACKKGVAEFFVPCHKIGKIYGSFIYEMDFVDADEELVTSDMWQKCSGTMSGEEISDAIDDDDCYIENLFPFYYSEEEMSKLYDFLCELEINDLHSGNIGYLDGRIVLIDYSGYFPYGF